MKVHIFSSKLLGCQREALGIDSITIRKPLQLLISVKDILESIIFGYYNVAVVDSQAAEIALGLDAGKLELISVENLRKNYSQYAITVAPEDSQNEHLSFFKDIKDNIYQARCDKKDHMYHITSLLTKPTFFTYSVNECHSQISTNVDNDIIPDTESKSDALDTNKDTTGKTDKDNTTDITDEEKTTSTTDEESTTSTTDEESTTSTTDEESTTDTDTDTGTDRTLPFHLLHNQSHREGNTTDERIEYLSSIITYDSSKSIYTTKQCQEFEKRLKNKPKQSLSSIHKKIMPASFSKDATDNNTGFINVLKKSPYIFEIFEDTFLLDSFHQQPQSAIQALQNEFLDKPVAAASLGDYRRVSIYYYMAILNESSIGIIKIIKEIMRNMETSFFELNYQSLFDLKVLRENISGEVIHCYLKHKTFFLQRKVKNFYRNTDISIKSEHEKYTDLLFNKMLNDVQIRFNSRYWEDSDSTQTSEDITGNPLFCTFQWHYEFAKMSEPFSGIGFEDHILYTQKKSLLGTKNWKKLKDIYDDMKKFSVVNFQNETQALTEEIMNNETYLK